MRHLLMLILVLPAWGVTGQIKNPTNFQSFPVTISQPIDNFDTINGQFSPKAAPNTTYRNAKSIAFSAKQKAEEPRVIFKNQQPVFIERKVPPFKSEAGISLDEKFFRFMDESKSITGIHMPREAFKILSHHKDNLGITHIKSIQQYRGIELYGTESTLHIDSDKERFTGSFGRIAGDLSEIPGVDTVQVLRSIIADLKIVTLYRELTSQEQKLLNYSFPQFSLVYYPVDNNSYRLTWLVSIRPNLIEEWKYFVDAQSGEILRRYNNTMSDGPMLGNGEDLNNTMRTFDVYLLGDIYYLYNITESMYNPSNDEGIIVTLDANNTSTYVLDYSYVTSTNNTWTHRAAISAHCNAAKVYEYFDTTFNWKSVNGKGGNILSLVNVTEEDGSSMDNAFWNGQAVFYGNGGEKFTPLAGALDVTAHELGHGVVSNTANLEYYGQSGAINESFADIFACMVDRDDWSIGEDITKINFSPSGVTRDLSNPNNLGDSTKPYWQPAHLSEIYLGKKDNGGVHLNSGIINYAYYLYATEIGKVRAEQVFFRALTEYLSKTSGFIDLRIAVIQSTRDLYGENSREVGEAAKAFDAVGIHDEESINETPVYETNPGSEFLLSYDTNPSDPASIYLSSAQGTEYRALTTTPMRGKASVTDNGTKAVFVSNDYRLRMINLDPANPNEQIISGSSSYDNVAISKDGKRIAATKVYMDASIYVIDLVSGNGRRFILYNPTTGDNDSYAGGVMKADALEFDITGEYLIYDSYNVISSNSQKDIYYWDIGFIKVWDNNINDFGSGTVSKLFNSLPANVSLANPVFSKNSPNIVAFDYFYDDGVIEEYGIYGADIESGITNKIIANDRLGFPSFSTHDDKIAYSTVNGNNMQVIKAISLRSDKITSKGEAGVLVPDAKWPVFYAKGLRKLGLAPTANFTADYKKGGLPLNVRFVDLSDNRPTSWMWIAEGGTPDTSTSQHPEITFDIPGTYKITLIAVNEYGTDTLIKESYIHAYDATGLDNPETSPVSTFPNPVNDILYIDSRENFTASLFNLQGELLINRKNESPVDVSLLKPGIYLLVIETKSGSFRYKLVKQ